MRFSVLCGASYLQVHDDEELRIHPKEEDLGHSNALTNVVQDYDWTCSSLLKLIENVQKIYEFLGTITNEDTLSLLLKELVAGDESQSVRSLPQECLLHDVTCPLASPPATQPTVRPLLSLAELRSLLNNNMDTHEHLTDTHVHLTDTHAVFAILKVDSAGHTVCGDKTDSIQVSGNFEGLRLNSSILKVESFTFHSEGDEMQIFLENYKEISPDSDIVCDMTSSLGICEAREYLVSCRSNIHVNRKGAQYFFVLCNDQNGERLIFKINKVSKYYLMGEHKLFRVKGQKISLLESESYEINKYYGNLPLFEVGEDAVEILTKRVKEVAADKKYYDLKNADLIPLDEPVNIKAVVVERSRETCQTDSLSSKLCLKISPEDLSVSYNMYLASGSSYGRLLEGM